MQNQIWSPIQFLYNLNLQVLYYLLDINSIYNYLCSFKSVNLVFDIQLIHVNSLQERLEPALR